MGKSILLVDDSVFARSIIRKAIELYDNDNLSVFEAYNGYEALSLMKIHDIDFVITDLNMPDYSGEDLLKAIRSDDNFNNIPVVIITSLLNPAREERLLREGALAILQKPVTLPKIKEVLSQNFELAGGI